MKTLDRMTLEALAWLEQQADWCLETGVTRGERVTLTMGALRFTGADIHDAVCSAYETLFVQPALREEREGNP